MPASASASASKWASKLSQKLSALTPSSSPESFRTLAKWICFNRKHMATDFVPVLLRTPPGIVLSVIDAVLAHEDDAKVRDVKAHLGDVLVPLAKRAAGQDQQQQQEWQKRLQPWETKGALDAKLLTDIRAALQGEAASESSSVGIVSTEKTATPATSTAEPENASRKPAEDALRDNSTTPQEPVAAEESNSPVQKTAPSQTPSKLSPTTATKTEATATTPISKTTTPPSRPRPKILRTSSVSSATKDAVHYDMEATGVPPRKVDATEFLRPCKDIATLQIARDLRSDAAVHVSAQLQSLDPTCRTLTLEDWEALEETAQRDRTAKVPQAVLDLDLKDQLQNATHYSELVVQQRQARSKLLRLLQESRCDFGANEVAAKLYNETDLSVLQERKQVLADAMELEGLDVQKETAVCEELPPLSWYTPAATTTSSSATVMESEVTPGKRQKVE